MEKIGVPNPNESITVEAFWKGLTKGQPLYDYLTMESLTSMFEVLRQANKFIKLEDSKWIGQKEKAKEEKRNTRLDVKEPIKRPSCKLDTRRFGRVKWNFLPWVNSVEKYILDPWKENSLSLTPEGMVEHLKGQRFVKWPQKMSSNLKGQDNNKLCSFHND